MAVGLAACSGSVVAQTDVEDKISTEFGAQFEIDSLPVDCPDDLEAEVGATLRCDLTDPEDGTVYPVDVVVDSVDGDTANFSFEIGEPSAS